MSSLDQNDQQNSSSHWLTALLVEKTLILSVSVCSHTARMTATEAWPKINSKQEQE